MIDSYRRFSDFWTDSKKERILIPQRRPLVDDGSPDIAGYNKELEQRGNPKWFDVPWLFSECYLYRYEKLQHLST